MQNGFLPVRQFLKWRGAERSLLMVLLESVVGSFLEGYLDGTSPCAGNSQHFALLGPISSSV